MTNQIENVTSRNPNARWRCWVCTRWACRLTIHEAGTDPSANTAAADQSMWPSAQCVISVGIVSAETAGELGIGQLDLGERLAGPGPEILFAESGVAEQRAIARAGDDSSGLERTDEVARDDQGGRSLPEPTRERLGLDQPVLRQGRVGVSLHPTLGVPRRLAVTHQPDDGPNWGGFRRHRRSGPERPRHGIHADAGNTHRNARNGRRSRP